MVLQCYGAVFGDRAIELAGRVVHPAHQQNGLATTMLREYIRAAQPEFITTYTRSPSILRMIGRVCSELYPLVQDQELEMLATHMPYASMRDVAYHLDRYGEEGLFRGNDPADRAAAIHLPPLRQQFKHLGSVRNALVVAARVK